MGHKQSSKLYHSNVRLRVHTGRQPVGVGPQSDDLGSGPYTGLTISLVYDPAWQPDSIDCECPLLENSSR